MEHVGEGQGWNDVVTLYQHARKIYDVLGDESFERLKEMPEKHRQAAIESLRLYRERWRRVFDTLWTPCATSGSPERNEMERSIREARFRYECGDPGVFANQLRSRLERAEAACKNGDEKGKGPNRFAMMLAAKVAMTFMGYDFNPFDDK